MDIDVVLCTEKDLDILTNLNKQLIEDEQSDNAMNIKQLRDRMEGFIRTDYNAYLFKNKNDNLGYALVNKMKSPPYLRQFYISRSQRKKGIGTLAFRKLLQTLKADTIDIEVLCWNKTGKSFWESLGFKERSIYMRFEK